MRVATPTPEYPLVLEDPEVVQALLAGRQAEVRFVIDHEPGHRGFRSYWQGKVRGRYVQLWGRYSFPGVPPPVPRSVVLSAASARRCSRPSPDYTRDGLRCPAGMAGDRVWLREVWRPSEVHEDDRTVHIEYQAGGSWYADGVEDWERYGRASRTRWRSATRMPRWASRLSLEVLDVAVEQESVRGPWVWVVELKRAEASA